MKNLIICMFILLTNNLFVNSQKLPNNSDISIYKSTQQIKHSAIDNILEYQAWNKAPNNYVLIRQNGEHNKANIRQHQASNSEISNQNFSIQLGNYNELNTEQIGNDNFILSAQLGYIMDKKINKGNQTDFENKFCSIYNNSENGYFVEGERNKMSFRQTGANNSIEAVQQGSDNSVSSTQIGNYNKLLIVQKGANNRIDNYKQQNKSAQVLSDKIIQMGDNNSLETNGELNGGMTGNTFTQIGNNLALKFNNEILNSPGGIEIDQKGKEMKVVIEQSFFSFPMK